jgi:hypothetical protein
MDQQLYDSLAIVDTNIPDLSGLDMVGLILPTETGDWKLYVHKFCLRAMYRLGPIGDWREYACKANGVLFVPGTSRFIGNVLGLVGRKLMDEEEANEEGSGNGE